MNTQGGRLLGLAIAGALWCPFPGMCSDGSRLLVSTEATRIDWCGPSEIAFPEAHLTLRFTNAGKKPMILSRLLVPHRDLSVLDSSGKPASVLSLYEFASFEPGTSPDPAFFETLGPGASTLRDFAVTFPVSRENATPPFDSVSGPGIYSISVTLFTWPFLDDAARAKRMKRAWERYGVLVTEDVKIRVPRVDVSFPSGDVRMCGRQ